MGTCVLRGQVHTILHKAFTSPMMLPLMLVHMKKVIIPLRYALTFFEVMRKASTVGPGAHRLG